MGLPWPFASITAPNLDTGIVAIGTVATVITALPVRIHDVLIVNTRTTEETVRITDGSDVTVIPDVVIPPKTTMSLNEQLRGSQFAGLKWLSSQASGVQGKVEAWT